MKTIILMVLAVISSSIYAKENLLHRWKLSNEATSNGGKIRAYQRWVLTPKAKYTVADLTVLELPTNEKQNTDTIPDILKSTMELEGFTHTKIKDTDRYEGYSPKLRRQVLIQLTTTPTSIKVTSAFYRPFYGRKLALEVELFQRLEHKVISFKKVSFVPNFLNMILQNAYAADDCSACAGNPSCLLLCRSANSGSSISAASSPSIMGMDLSGIETELNSSNQQLSDLNASILQGANGIDSASAQWSVTNKQIATTSAEVNANWGTTNDEAKKLNENLEKVNGTLQTESDQWQNIVNEKSDRALAVAEKMSDPGYMFKLSASSAAGAVIGASVANLAISGIKAAVGFLVKWATGDLRKMKDEEILKEFNNAMTVYDQSSKLGEDLEKRIDNILASMELHQRFKLSNSDVLENIQRYVINTNFEIEDATACRDTDKLIDLNRQLLEYQSLAKILDVPNPLQKMCKDMREAFDKLADIEGVLQNARPNLLRAEAALNRRKSDHQNDSARALDKLRNGNMDEEVLKAQTRQRRKLYERNIKDSQDLKKDILNDCEDSFDKIASKPPKRAIRSYCDTLFTMDKSAPQFNLGTTFPTVSAADRTIIAQRFATKYIPMGLEKHAVFERQREELFSDFDAESKRHQEVSQNLKDRLNVDPEVALRELESINRFMEKIMNEQAYLYTNGLKDKKRKIEEACANGQ